MSDTPDGRLRIILYKVDNRYFSTIEGCALLGLRIGLRGWGIAWWQRRKGGYGPPWFVPRFRLDINMHSGQCDQVWLFRVHIMDCELGYKTRGDATPDMMSYYEAGWRVILRSGNIGPNRWYWLFPKIRIPSNSSHSEDFDEEHE